MVKHDTEQPSREPRVLLISHDVVGKQMAGPGIRSWELASVLAQAQPVTLVAPNDGGGMVDAEARGVVCGTYRWGDRQSLQAWLEGADVVVANGFVLQAHPELSDIRQPLVLDLYDPTLLENLELFRHAESTQRQARSDEDHALLSRQLAAGDFFLCATERQRDLYIGALMAAGRVVPARLDADPQLHDLIAVVPFGLPSEPPEKHETMLRGVVDGISTDDPVILWTGGLWDWMDPLSLVEAMPAVAAQHPDVRLVFLAGQHPGNAHPMEMPRRARERAEALHMQGRHIFFYDEWVAYEQRGALLLEATIAVSLHRNHLETRYAAVRSRILDHLWAGLSGVVSAGDPAATLLQQAGAALVVEPSDQEALTDALCRLLSDSTLRETQAQAASELARTLTWEQVAEPLAQFCRAPWHTRPTLPDIAKPAEAPAEPAEPAEAPAEPAEATGADADYLLESCRNAALDVQEQTWRLQEKPIAAGRLGRVRQFLIDQIVRPFVAPYLEQQQEYNSAILRSLYAINETTDHRYRVFKQQDAERGLAMEHLRQGIKQSTESLSHRVHHVENLSTGQQDALDSLAQRVHGVENDSRGLREYIERIEEHANELGLRTLDIKARIEKIKENDRMTRQQIYDFAEQLAGLEEADNQMLLFLLEQNSSVPAPAEEREKT